MKSLTPILTGATILLLLLGGYAGAYLALGDREYGYLNPPSSDRFLDRIYPYTWADKVFAPAAWVESKVRSIDVRAQCWDDPFNHRSGT